MYSLILNRPKLLKKCEKITGSRYDYCFSRGHWHEAICFNVKEGFGHNVYFTQNKYDDNLEYTKEEIQNKKFLQSV